MTGLLPQIMDSISSFFQPIMETMFAIQTDLYQHLYASMHEFVTAQGLLDTDTIVDDCVAKYEPIRQHAESEIRSLREGKVARTPMGESGKPGMFSRKSSSSLSATRTSTAGGKTPPLPGSWDRRPSNSSLSSGKTPPPPPPPSLAPPSYDSLRPLSNSSLPTPPTLDSLRRPSNSIVKASPPPPPTAPSPLLAPTPTSRQNSYSGASSRASRTPSPSSINGDSSSLSMAAAAAKKKPPPPPPKPKAISPKPEFVVAKYDFAGESEGDLAFRTGDRIRVVRKTESLEDWWEGELNGVKGSFPRNYCS